jgi:hypothetical protein
MFMSDCTKLCRAEGAIKDNLLFQGLPSAALAAIIDSMQPRTALPGKDIIKQVTPGRVTNLKTKPFSSYLSNTSDMHVSFFGYTRAVIFLSIALKRHVMYSWLKYRTTWPSVF